MNDFLINFVLSNSYILTRNYIDRLNFVIRFEIWIRYIFSKLKIFSTKVNFVGILYFQHYTLFKKTTHKSIAMLKFIVFFFVNDYV